MEKIEVGDIVRVKPVEEWKIIKWLNRSAIIKLSACNQVLRVTYKDWDGDLRLEGFDEWMYSPSWVTLISKKGENSMYQDKKEEGFWIVWNPLSSVNPSVKHFAQSVAQSEADRLAVKHPGQTFYVMEVKGGSVANSVQRLSF